MKKVLMIMVSILVVSSNLYAAGDLNVEGDARVNGTLSIGSGAAPGPDDAAWQVVVSADGTAGGLYFKADEGVGIQGYSYNNTGMYGLSLYGIGVKGRGQMGGAGGYFSSAFGPALVAAGSVKIGSRSAQANKALCWTSTGAIGYCSSAIGATGECTCNEIY